ncbi:hypothetical protein K502DRAFT_348540 [Neoconidiobolus thromboides FSU 785]|nr:hypothetical protein K502DRAFT_348540 [Neoconidiobolus thromboides FSU 785]
MHLDYSNINIPKIVIMLFIYRSRWWLVLLTFLYIERFMFMATYMIYNPMSQTLTQGKCQFFVPVNKNTNFAYILSTLRPDTCFMVNESIPGFCDDYTCLLTGHKEGYPIKSYKYRKTMCSNNNGATFKIDDNTFLPSVCIENCYKACQILGCCICGEKHGDFLSGTTHGLYHFPVGKYYYMNEKATKAYCTAFAEEEINEDFAVGLFTQKACTRVHYATSNCGVKRTYYAYGTEHRIVKNENH